MPSMIDSLGKHLEYENTQKKIATFFLQFGHSKKKTRKKSVKPVLNWLTLSYAPGVTFLLIHLKLKPTFFFKL